MKIIFKYIIACCVIIQFSFYERLNGQFMSKLNGEVDTSYIDELPLTFTTRVFLSRKFTDYQIKDNNLHNQLHYKPNDRLVGGFGFNYGLIGLNIGFGLNFLETNQDQEKYGKTSYIDLQAHWYLRKLTIDFIFQRYSGYYLSNPYEMITGWPSNDTLPKRADMISIPVGLNVQYIFNSEKFSYKASFVQTEVQKKSAGSMILGGQFYYLNMRGDSSLIPANIAFDNFFEGHNYRRSDSYSLGGNFGYAHTFVIKSKFFFALSFTGGVSLAWTILRSSETDKKDKSGLTLGFNSTSRFALGWNSKIAYLGVSYVYLPFINQAPVHKGWIRWGTGVLRFNVVYRFKLKKPIKILDPSLW